MVDEPKELTLPSAEVETAAVGTSAPPAAVAASGHVIAERYVLERELGRGGMGAVWLAHDRRLGRAVAVKMLTRPGSTERLARMRREAQSVAKLAHPNVANVYDVGLEDGRPYIVMEYVDGGDLRDWLDSKPRPHWRAIVKMFVQAGRGLVVAHRAGLVHRDFKPANVLVGKGRARVVDFGLARVSGDHRPATPNELDALDDATLTRSGVALGTPVYMAPEQHMGRPVTAAADVFAFACSLYEALYRERPFAGKTLTMLLQAKVAGPPAVPPASAVPRRVYDVVARGLAPVPNERWGSMQEFLRALRSAARRGRGAPVILLGVAAVAVVVAVASGSPSSAATPCEEPGRRVRDVWMANAKAELRAVFDGSAVEGAPEIRDRVVEDVERFAMAWATAETQACADPSRPEFTGEMDCLAVGLRRLRALIEATRGADDAVVRRAGGLALTLPEPAQCLDRDRVPDEALPTQPQARAEAERIEEQVATARALLVAGRIDDGAALMRQALASAQALDHGPVLCRTQYRAVRALGLAGATDDELDPLVEGCYERAVAERLDRCAADCAIYRAKMGPPGDRGRWIEAARSAVARTGDPDDEIGLAEAEGVFALAEDRVEDSIALLEGAVRKSEAHTARPTQLGPLLFNLSEAYIDARRFDDARRTLERELALVQGTYGPEHPDLARSWLRLAFAESRLNNVDRAKALRGSAIALLEKTLGPSHPDLAAAHNAMADTAYRAGQPEEAVFHLRRALDILGDRDPRNAGIAQLNLAGVLRDIGRLDEARSTLQRLVATLQETDVADSTEMARARLELGRVAADAGDPRRALEQFEVARRIRQGRRGSNSPDVATVDVEIAVARFDLGEVEAALELMRTAIDVLREAAVPALEIATQQVVLADLLQRSGDPQSAKAVLDEAAPVIERDGTEVDQERLKQVRAAQPE